MSAIPCLSYRRALEEEKNFKDSLENKSNGNSILNEKPADELKTASNCPYANGETLNGIDEKMHTSAETNKDEPPPAKKSCIFGAFSNAKIETVNENLKEQSLTVQQINDYCKSLFIFKNIRVMRFT